MTIRSKNSEAVCVLIYMFWIRTSRMEKNFEGQDKKHRLKSRALKRDYLKRALMEHRKETSRKEE